MSAAACNDDDADDTGDTDLEQIIRDASRMNLDDDIDAIFAIENAERNDMVKASTIQDCIDTPYARLLHDLYTQTPEDDKQQLIRRMFIFVYDGTVTDAAELFIDKFNLKPTALKRRRDKDTIDLVRLLSIYLLEQGFSKEYGKINRRYKMFDQQEFDRDQGLTGALLAKQSLRSIHEQYAESIAEDPLLHKAYTLLWNAEDDVASTIALELGQMLIGVWKQKESQCLRDGLTIEVAMQFSQLNNVWKAAQTSQQAQTPQKSQPLQPTSSEQDSAKLPYRPRMMARFVHQTIQRIPYLTDIKYTDVLLQKLAHQYAL